MGIDIYKEKFYDGLQFVMEQHKDRINEIKNKLFISNAKKNALLQEKKNNTLDGLLISFCLDGKSCRDFYLIQNQNGEKFVVTDDGFVCYCDEFYSVMKEIYGNDVDAIVQKTPNSQLLATCRIQ